MLGFDRAASRGGHVALGLFERGSDACERLVVILVRPSKYDDDGYVIRHFRGTLPSNTLSCLNSLTDDVVRQGALGAVDVRVELIDEIVTRVDPAALGRRFRRAGTRVVVGLVGAILGLRAMYFLLAGAVERFHLLHYGLALILVFVGLKMVWLNEAFGGKFPIEWSLGIIAALLGGSIVASLLKKPQALSLKP